MKKNETEEQRPDYFYKYMAAEVAMNVLSNRTLRWSTSHVLNDPKDLKTQFAFFEGDREKAKSMFLEKSWNMFLSDEEIPQNIMGEILKVFKITCSNIPREEFDKQMGLGFDQSFSTMQSVALKRFNEEYSVECANTKVLCFSENPVNSLMWVHYADSHRGVVMAFQNAPGVDSPYVCAQPVRYVKTIPCLYDEESLSDLLAGRRDLSTPDFKRKIMEAFALTKSIEWSYEQEWRIVQWDAPSNEAHYEDGHFHELELKKIIFGCKMAFDKRMELQKLANILYPHVDFCEANFKEPPSEYEMEIKKLPQAGK
jgi:hypothetical protein